VIPKWRALQIVESNAWLRASVTAINAPTIRYRKSLNFKVYLDDISQKSMESVSNTRKQRAEAERRLCGLLEHLLPIVNDIQPLRRMKESFCAGAFNYSSPHIECRWPITTNHDEATHLLAFIQTSDLCVRDCMFRG
jgi:hypothetical protein